MKPGECVWVPGLGWVVKSTRCARKPPPRRAASVTARARGALAKAAAWMKRKAATKRKPAAAAAAAKFGPVEVYRRNDGRPRIYGPGDIITAIRGGRRVRVLVELHEADVKDGEPGWEGTTIGPDPANPGRRDSPAWGFDEDVRAVQRRRRAGR